MSTSPGFREAPVPGQKLPVFLSHRLVNRLDLLLYHESFGGLPLPQGVPKPQMDIPVLSGEYGRINYGA